MIHFNRGGGGVQCNYPVGSQASKVGQGSFGPTPAMKRHHSPVLPFKSSDTLFTSATPGGNSSFDHSGGWTAERDVCPYATFQMPQQQVEHFQFCLRRRQLL